MTYAQASNETRVRQNRLSDDRRQHETLGRSSDAGRLRRRRGKPVGVVKAQRIYRDEIRSVCDAMQKNVGKIARETITTPDQGCHTSASVFSTNVSAET